MNVNEAQRINLKVWARRMGVSITEGHYEYLAQIAPGSVLRGPLMMVFANGTREIIPDVVKRKEVATIAADAAAVLLRAECTQGWTKNTLLQYLRGTSSNSNAVNDYGDHMVTVILTAFKRRDEEKATPSVINKVMAQVQYKYKLEDTESDDAFT